MGCDNQLPGQEEAVPGGEGISSVPRGKGISSHSAVSEHGAVCAPMQSLSLTNAHILPCSHCVQGLEEPAGITLQLLEKRPCNIHPHVQ